MTLFRSKNVFFIAQTLFSIKKKHLNVMTTITLEFRIIYNVDLKSEISEVSAHLNYFRAKELSLCHKL